MSTQMLKRNVKRTLILALALATCGCAGAKVAVPTGFPVPHVLQVPLPVGLYMDEALLSYVHRESLEGHGDWEIDLGSAQRPMFDNLLSGLFIGHRFVKQLGASHDDIAGVLAPSIEELQFSIPEQTRSEYYEVWIRYRFELHGNDGEKLGHWDLTAYGKAHRQNHAGASAALQSAALVACRDAMAFFTQQFGKEPLVQTWLESELGNSA